MAPRGNGASRVGVRDEAGCQQGLACIHLNGSKEYMMEHFRVI